MPRLLRRTVLTAAAFAALVPASAQAQAPACADADLEVTAATASRAADAVRCLVDAERTARGLSPLGSESRLVTAALGFAQTMVAGGFFDHTGEDGSTPASRVTAAGYLWSAVGENIALGQDTPREVMTAWMRSAGHCRNVLAPGYTELGVGVAPGARGPIWVQDFARPRGASAPAGADTAAACPAAGLTTSAASGGSGGGSGTTTGSAPAGSGAGASDPSSGTGAGADDAATRGARALRVTVGRRGRVLRISGTVTGARTVKVQVGRRTRTVAVRNGRFAVRVAGRKGTRVTVRAGALKLRRTAR